MPRLPRNTRVAVGGLLAAAAVTFVLGGYASWRATIKMASVGIMPTSYEGILEVADNRVRVVGNARLPGADARLAQSAGLMTVQPKGSGFQRITTEYLISITGTPELFARLAETSPGQLADDFQRACGWWPEGLAMPSPEAFDPSSVARSAPFWVKRSVWVQDPAFGRLRPRFVAQRTAEITAVPLLMLATGLAVAAVLLPIDRAISRRRVSPAAPTACPAYADFVDRAD